MGWINYISNNSGGNWWLKDKDWEKLESMGWTVHWEHSINQDHGDFDGKGSADDPHEWEKKKSYSFGHDHKYGSAQRVKSEPDGSSYLGAKATSAGKETDDPEKTIHEWEMITGQNADAEGCNCCGNPHNFTYIDDKGKEHYSSVEVTQTRRSWW